jgi:lipoate-protein ligase A
MNAFSGNPADAETMTSAHQCICAAEEQAWNACSLADTVSEPRLRLWTYRDAALVLGSSQRGMAEGLHAPRRLGVELVVRASGGGAVLVGPWMLSASIVLPIDHRLIRGSLVESYRWLGEAYAGVLGELGLPARAVAPDAARELQRQADREDLGWSCYGGMSPWEVVVGARKIVGLAQVRKRTGVLLTAGLLVGRTDWKLLCQAMERPDRDAGSLAQLTTSCREELASVPCQAEVARRLGDSLQQAIRA